MPIVKITQTGQTGVNKDLSAHELPPNAWTDANNIRFLDGLAHQSYGYGEVYDSPSYVPQYVMPCNIGTARYWIYPSASKIHATTISGGSAVHTDITHLTPLTGVTNNWTGTLLSGIPILNAGNATNVPVSWDLNIANKFVDLANWPASTYCKSLRSYKNYLIALNITKTTTNYPYMVKWSHPADPGTLPDSWDETDATKDAGETDLAEGFGAIVDGMQLRDSFIIYKESSTFKMDFVGGAYVFRFSKIFETSGVMNRNCIADIAGRHVVLTQSDIIVHDGVNSESCLDKQTRRAFFQDIDTDYQHLCFVYKNPFFNEVLICYPAIGSTVCNKAVVWNYKDRTVSFRDMPNVTHGAAGAVDNTLTGTWASDGAPWSSDLSLWNGGDYVPNIARTIVGSTDTKLYMMDSSASYAGSLPSAYMERVGLSFGSPESIKLIKSVRPRIVGNTGDTVTIKVGYSDDPYTPPTYTTMTHTIGSTIANDCLVSGRYIAIWFGTGTAYQWRLDSYDLDVELMGAW